ncbi:hypothetical protein IFR05_015587 [Cadophora sp. M221]|nr:hypothetical protein IFR05_015587 [Cadophora sp. M221]
MQTTFFDIRTHIKDLRIRLPEFSISHLRQQLSQIQLPDALSFIKASPWTTFAIASISYLTVVRALRYRAINQMKRKYARFEKDPYSMNYKSAHEIMLLSMLYDTPWMHFFGTSLALVKTYTIASGTSLLVATRQLTTSKNVGKRAEDTGVAIAEFVIGSVDSERGLRALSKVNWLHGRYGAKVKNRDMTHTLAMFVLEPQRWIDAYEWRPMTYLEKVAMFVYWKEVGNRMGIEDIPPTLEKLQEWTAGFEEENMVYSDDNKICAETTMELYLRGVPSFARGFAKNVANSLLEDRVRVALGSPDPPSYVKHLAVFILKARGWVVRNFFLPRLSYVDPLAKKGPDGRLLRDRFAFEPWYVKDSWLQKLGIWLSSGGRLVPGDEWKTSGYLPEEIGPFEYIEKSREPVLQQAEAMRKYAESGGAAVMGCPFSFGK